MTHLWLSGGISEEICMYIYRTKILLFIKENVTRIGGRISWGFSFTGTYVNFAIMEQNEVW